MDLVAVRRAAPALLRWPPTGAMLELRPLPPAALAAARAEAAAWVAAHGVTGERVEQLEVGVRVAARALELPVDEVRCAVDPGELLAILCAWGRAQDEATRTDGLRSIIRKAIHRDPMVMMDGLAAYHAERADVFFGAPLPSLTEGQLLYFLHVRAAYDDYFVAGGGDVKVSKRWLEQS